MAGQGGRDGGQKLAGQTRGGARGQELAAQIGGQGGRRWQGRQGRDWGALTTERVPAQRGEVSTGPGAQQATTAFQALLQPPLGLPELILVQGPRGQELPGPQAEGSFAFPGGSGREKEGSRP